MITDKFTLYLELYGYDPQYPNLAVDSAGRLYGEGQSGVPEAQWVPIPVYWTRGGWLGFAFRNLRYGTFLRADPFQLAGGKVTLVQAWSVDGYATFIPSGSPLGRSHVLRLAVDRSYALQYVPGGGGVVTGAAVSSKEQLFQFGFQGRVSDYEPPPVYTYPDITVGGDAALACEAVSLLPVTLAAQAQADGTLAMTDLHARMDYSGRWGVMLAHEGGSFAGLRLVTPSNAGPDDARLLAFRTDASRRSWNGSPVEARPTGEFGSDMGLVAGPGGRMTVRKSFEYKPECDLDLVGDPPWLPGRGLRTASVRPGPSQKWALVPGPRDWRWSATEDDPGVAVDPVATLAEGDTATTWCVGQDNQVWRRGDGPAGAAWRTLGGPAPVALDAKPIAAFRFQGRPYLCLRTAATGLLQHYDSTGSDTWTWYDTQAPVGVHDGLGALIVYGRPHVAVLGNDGRVYMHWYGDQWKWSCMGGSGIRGVVGSTLAGNGPHVFVITDDGHLWDLRQPVANSDWSWHDCGKPAPGVRAVWGLAAFTSTGRPYAFVQGDDYQVWAAWASDGVNFGWSCQGGTGGPVAGAGAVVYAEAYPCLFMNCGDEMWMHWWDGRTWRWSSRGSLPSSIVQPSRLGAVTAGGRTTVAVATTSRKLGLFRYEPARRSRRLYDARMNSAPDSSSISFGLAGRTCIVTGGSQGIGEACARRFAREGAKVVLADLADDRGQALARELGGLYVHCDVGDKAQVDALVAKTVLEHGRIDVLVNNAGIFKAADFLDVSEADFDAVLRVNLKGAFLVGQAVAREMAQVGKGAIVNMSSVNAVLAIPNIASYNVSKGGINQLTRVMALALADQGIRVNAVAPGTIATELAAKAVLTSEEAKKKIMSRTPMKRLGEPSEIADVVAWLASDAASYVTGEIVVVDGGRMTLNYTVPV